MSIHINIAIFNGKYKKDPYRRQATTKACSLTAFIAGNVKHRIQTLIHKNYLLLLLCLLSLGSCKIAEPVQQPATVKTPETFTGSTDTSSIGYHEWSR
jgi:hypothetical protein